MRRVYKYIFFFLLSIVIELKFNETRLKYLPLILYYYYYYIDTLSSLHTLSEQFHYNPTNTIFSDLLYKLLHTHLFGIIDSCSLFVFFFFCRKSRAPRPLCGTVI